jgi:hypothetical protein
MDLTLKAVPPELLNQLLNRPDWHFNKRCILCDDEAFFIGLHTIPEINQAFVYCLCKLCLDQPESPRIVAKVINFYQYSFSDDVCIEIPWGEC